MGNWRWRGGGSGAPQVTESFSLATTFGEAFASIPANLYEALGATGDPLGIDIGHADDIEAATAQQEVAIGTFGAMQARFDGAAGAFAYLLFILLYTPCTASIAAIHLEIGGRWTAFVVAWTTGIAYAAGTLAYQIGTFTHHPTGSALWSTAIFAALGLTVWLLRSRGVFDLGRAVPAKARETSTCCH